MASQILTLADLIARNDKNLDPIYVTDLLQSAPLIRALNAKPSSNGTNHSWLKTIVAPTPGFRTIGAGRDHGKSQKIKVQIALAILDATFHVDKAYADAHKLGPDGAIEEESLEAVRAAFSHAEKQLIYGIPNDPSGYTGLADNPELAAVAKDTVVDAGFTASPNCSSVYLVRSDDTNVSVVAGNNSAGMMLDVQPRFEQLMTDAVGKLFPAYVAVIQAWLGLQIASNFSAVRIANLGPDASTNTLTDDMIAEAISRFPSDRQPTHMAMSRRSAAQLRASRTATSTTGAPAPFATESFNIPIIVTDSVSDKEAVVA